MVTVGELPHVDIISLDAPSSQVSVESIVNVVSAGH